MAFPHHDCIKVRGRFYFEKRYAAKLLKTSKVTVETLVIRGKLRSKEIEGVTYIPEAQVTELRRDAAAWKALKSQAKLPSASKRPEIGGIHRRHPDQEVLPIADYRLQLGRGMKLED